MAQKNDGYRFLETGEKLLATDEVLRSPGRWAETLSAGIRIGEPGTIDGNAEPLTYRRKLDLDPAQALIRAIETAEAELADLQTGITVKATDTVWYSDMVTAVERISEIRAGLKKAQEAV